MALARLKINSPTIQDYLDGGGGVDSLLRSRAEAVASAARSNAPVETGAYRDSIAVTEDHTDRMVLRVGANVDYALAVEAEHGVMARSADAAG